EAFIHFVESDINLIESFVHTSEQPCQTSEEATAEDYQNTGSSEDNRNHFGLHVHTSIVPHDHDPTPSNLDADDLCKRYRRSFVENRVEEFFYGSWRKLYSMVQIQWCVCACVIVRSLLLDC